MLETLLPVLRAQAQQAASKAASQVQGAPAGGGSSGLDALGDSIKKASITDKSPAGALAKVLFTPLQQFAVLDECDAPRP